MKIAIGGMKKNVMADAIAQVAPEVETVITTDIEAVPMLKNGDVDCYFGACESGGGAAISILIGMIGYNKCCTVAKNGQRPNPEQIRKFVEEGKIVFGMAHDAIEQTVPILMQILLK